MIVISHIFFEHGTTVERPSEIEPPLKVSKFQKQILLFSFEPKNERNYFLISALVSKSGSYQKNEGIYYTY